MSTPRRVYFIYHCTGLFDWRAYEKPPTLQGECAHGCRVVCYKRVPLKQRKATKKKRNSHD